MKKIAILLFSIVSIVSCTNENHEGLILETTSKKEKLVVFENWKDFKDTSSELNNPSSHNLIPSWIIEKGHSSLYNEKLNIEDENDPLELNKLTPAFLAIFNKNLQFQVGDEVITYSNSVFYAQKKGSNSKKKIGEIEEYKAPVDNKTANKATNIWSDNGYALVQNKEFTRYFHDKCNGETQGKSSRRFKYRQQLRAYTYRLYLTYSVVVWLEAKLYINESTGSNSFKHDIGSRRNYTYNLYGNVDILGSTMYFGINEQRNCISGDNRTAKFNKLVLAQLDFPARPINHHIIVTGTGTITHEVNGNYASEKWINPVNW